MPALHLLLNLRGTYKDPSLSEETWQVGLRYRVSNVPGDPVGNLPTDVGVIPDTINRDETKWTITGNWSLDGPALTTFHADDWLNDQVAPACSALINQSILSTQMRLDRLDVYPIGPDGRSVAAPPYAAGSPVSLLWKAAQQPSGAGASGMMPLQMAWVMSLRTQQVGRHGRGRIYLAGLSKTASDATTTRVSSPDCIGAAAALRGFLVASSYSGPAPNPIVVQPIVTGAPWSTYALISTVRVGNVLDTQRRRRRSVAETYTDSAPL